MEKIYQKTKDKRDSILVPKFKQLADHALMKKLTQPFLEAHLLPYWKKGKRFTRKFWENPDANDPDDKAAFKKRTE